MSSDSYVRDACSRICRYFEEGARVFLSPQVKKGLEILHGYIDRPQDVSPESLEIVELFISRYNDMIDSMDSAAFNFVDEVDSLLDSFLVQGRRRLPRRIASGSTTDDRLVLDNTEEWLNWAAGSDSINTKLEGVENVVRMMRRLDTQDLLPETGRFVEGSIADLEGSVRDFHRAVDDAVEALDATISGVSSEARRLNDVIRSTV